MAVVVGIFLVCLILVLFISRQCQDAVNLYLAVLSIVMAQSMPTRFVSSKMCTLCVCVCDIVKLDYHRTKI